jgi:FMN-dependent NADH-azoreductase
MTRLLHIDSSPMNGSSDSRALAAAFREVWDDCPRIGPVVHRDVAADPLPHIDQDAVTTFFLPEQARTPAQRSAAQARTELARELLAADAVLVSAPMYNWTVPSSLKAWIDHVLIHGLTLNPPGQPGPMVGRSATIVLTYGGGYTPGAPQAGWDHIEPYLRTVFADALGMDTEIISAQLTTFFGTDTELAPLAAASRTDALAAIRSRADEVLARHAPVVRAPSRV